MYKNKNLSLDPSHPHNNLVIVCVYNLCFYEECPEGSLELVCCSSSPSVGYCFSGRLLFKKKSGETLENVLDTHVHTTHTHNK